MDTLNNANIFFLITSISTVVIALLAVIALIYIIIVFKNFRSISNKIKTETDFMVEDMEQLRRRVRTNRFFILPVIRFIKGVLSKN